MRIHSTFIAVLMIGSSALPGIELNGQTRIALRGGIAARPLTASVAGSDAWTMGTGPSVRLALWLGRYLSLGVGVDRTRSEWKGPDAVPECAEHHPARCNAWLRPFADVTLLTTMFSVESVVAIAGERVRPYVGVGLGRGTQNIDIHDGWEFPYFPDPSGWVSARSKVLVGEAWAGARLQVMRPLHAYGQVGYVMRSAPAYDFDPGPWPISLRTGLEFRTPLSPAGRGATVADAAPVVQGLERAAALRDYRASLYGTLVPLAAVPLAFAIGDESPVAGGLGLLGFTGILAGPSLGYFTAGRPARGAATIAVRLAGMSIMVAGLFLCGNTCDDTETTQSYAVLATGGAIVAGSAYLDIRALHRRAEALR